MKKGEAMALNTVAIGAIVLVVLLIVLFILYSTSNKTIPFFSKQSECKARGGDCIKEAECGDAKIYGLGCEKGKDGKDTGNVCCIKR